MWKTRKEKKHKKAQRRVFNGWGRIGIEPGAKGREKKL
jgi:hypothetical protein